MAAMTPGPGGWGHKVGAFIKAHPDHVIRGQADGYIAQRKTDGRAKGPILKAQTLDELAALIQAARADRGRG
jgi:hypothetical protein